MTMTTHRIGASQQYPWGHQVYVDFIDEETGRLQHEQIVTPAALSAEALAVAVEALRAATQARLEVAEAPTYRVISEDGTEVLL